jgi:hypothetical protein
MATDVDNVVGDDAEPRPALYSDVALVAAVQAVSPFDDADASPTSGAPFLAATEPTPEVFGRAACLMRT